MDPTEKTGAAYTFLLGPPEDLKPLVQALASVLKPGDCVFLKGDLGAGKTTLTQYLAQALEIDPGQYVSSPSFALLHTYTGPLPVYHMDLYRLADAEDVEAAGLLEYFDQAGVCVIEWPERLGREAPGERLDLTLVPLPDGTRRVRLEPRGQSWGLKLEQIAKKIELLPE